MNDNIGRLVRRKIGGGHGVVISSEPDALVKSEYLYEVAFGYLSKADALKHNKLKASWPRVHSSHLDYLGG
jgi:hypothetical protein